MGFIEAMHSFTHARTHMEREREVNRPLMTGPANRQLYKERESRMRAKSRPITDPANLSQQRRVVAIGGPGERKRERADK